MRSAHYGLRQGLYLLLLTLALVPWATCEHRNPLLLVYTGVHREQALDVWALTQHLVLTKGYEAVVLTPDSLATEIRETAGTVPDELGRQECSNSAINVITYASVSFEEYQPHGRGTIRELTGRLDFHLASCAGLLLNRTLIDGLTKRFTVMLGVAMDPCSTFLADKLKIRRRAVYDDGSSTSMLWGVLMGRGHPTSHVASYGTALGGGGAMTLYERTANLLQYMRLQLWRRRVYGARLAAFRQRHRLTGPWLSGHGGGGGGAPCHLRGQVVITGADWGLVEPQPLPPEVKLVGPLRAGPGGPATAALAAAAAGVEDPTASAAAAGVAGNAGEEVPAAPAAPPAAPPAVAGPLPAELAAHVAAAERGLVVICFPQDYRPPLRALLALAEAVIDLRLHIVWQAPEQDIARLRQLYLPLKHARHVLLLPPPLPLGPLLAHPQVVTLVTAASVQSLYQAIYHAKPVVAVPLSAVQEDLAARLAALGAGQRLSRDELEGGAASFRVSVALERMRNVYSYTQAMQQLSTQLRATLGSVSALDRAADWVHYTASLDDAGRQFLVPRSAPALAAGEAGGGSSSSGLGGGGGCMGSLEAVNAASYIVLIVAAVTAAGLAVLVVHVCTRVPPPAAPKRRGAVTAGPGAAAAGARGGSGGGGGGALKAKDE
ncbi:hypothetical protein Agub_g11421 [Astrephomene gubernaculifera]|uniref:Glucuronosyltransferase n=1 Tax=Astrephomene gubernaculifera TaxID=47775 RepID=A0AAD3DZ42_9CHLO|nr:hypothetical protein Agub_g11421 [Astrephomene gubernaculifera]